MNTREKLLGLSRKSQTVNIEGVTVIVKEMTAGEGADYENSLYKIVNGKPIVNTTNAKAKLIALTCFDEQGEKLFDMKDLEQVKLLPNSVSAKLFDIATEINKLEADEDAVKN